MGTDWYPNARDAQLHMAKTWLSVIGVKAAEWGVPQQRVIALESDIGQAENLLNLVAGNERTHTLVVQCNEVFKAMETEMRFMKKHYLLKPPLTDPDYASLLLPLPDSVHTPVGPPAGQPAVTITYPGGPHLLEVHLAPLSGTVIPDARGDYGCALYRGIRPAGGATTEQALSDKHYLINIPLSGTNLFYCRFTRRKTELIPFDAEDAGMTAYFCARYENQKGEAGQWGPIVSAIIP